MPRALAHPVDDVLVAHTALATTTQQSHLVFIQALALANQQQSDDFKVPMTVAWAKGRRCNAPSRLSGIRAEIVAVRFSKSISSAPLLTSALFTQDDLSHDQDPRSAQAATDVGYGFFE